MTPQPNEPTAEAEAALHAFSQLKRSQVAALQSELQDERDLNKKMGNALDERNNELAALRAENERLVTENNKLGNILTWIRKRVDQSDIRNTHTTLSMLIRKLDEVGLAAARDAELAQLRARLAKGT